MQNPEEMWQAKVNGEIYDANFAELTVWIAESSLLETDIVRRGNLRWLEAGKVPPLKEFFNAKAKGIAPPQVYVTTSEGEQVQDEHSIEEPPQDNNFINGVPQQFENEQFESDIDPQFKPIIPDTSVCNVHNELPSEYLCSACSHAFCRKCPQSFGTSVKICPYCGAMCNEINEFQSNIQRELQIQSDIAGGFGFDDFGKAIAYPFKFKSSLFFGGLMLAIFGIGQSAAAMGSIFLLAAALICFMLANAVTFGVLANTIDNFSQGFTEKDFMPNFDDFSLWDDVVHPFFLSVAVYISSFGLFILLIFGTVWYAWSSFAGQINQTAQTPYSTIPQSQQAQDHIKEVLEKYKKQNAGRTNLQVGEDGLTDVQRQTFDEEAEFQRINDLANNYRRDQLESQLGKTPETQQKEMQAMAYQFAKSAGIFIFLAGIAMLWGMFYFPAACAVAGYTRSFTATINPLVGLDTIKHLGIDYIKILVMCFLISLMSGIAGFILGIVFSVFNLPTFGNIPAKFLGGFVTFYFSITFAVTLGYAMYKNSNKLKLLR